MDDTVTQCLMDNLSWSPYPAVNPSTSPAVNSCTSAKTKIKIPKINQLIVESKLKFQEIETLLSEI
jgi:hypothetical protein